MSSAPSGRNQTEQVAVGLILVRAAPGMPADEPPHAASFPLPCEEHVLVVVPAIVVLIIVIITAAVVVVNVVMKYADVFFVFVVISAERGMVTNIRRQRGAGTVLTVIIPR